MNGHLELVPEPDDGGPAPEPLDIAVISDRIGWEEKSILEAARGHGARAEWLDDGGLCAGSRDDLPQAATYLIRSRSFVRGPLIAASIETGDGRVVNRAEVIDVCSNKVAALAKLRSFGIATVPYRLVLTRRDLAAALEALGRPLVLKPVFGGLGRRVMLVRDLDVADSLYDYVEHHGQSFDRALIAQPYMEGATDVRVLAIGGEAVAAMERVPDGDWRASVNQGADARPIDLDDRIRALASEVATRVGAGIFGIDLFRWAGSLVVGEVNHTPMFRGVAEATGLDIGDLIAANLLASSPVR